MTRYFTEMSRKLLSQPLQLPEGFRIRGERRNVLNPRAPWTAIMEVEDDGAPVELEGKLVTPTFQSHADGTVTILDRTIEDSR